MEKLIAFANLSPAISWLAASSADSEEQITTRLRNAQEELESAKEPGLYDYIIINSDLDEAYHQLASVARSALAGEVGGPEGSAGTGTAPAAAAAGAAAVTAGAAAAAAPGAEPGSGGSGGTSGSRGTTQGRSSPGAVALNSAATFKGWLQPTADGQLQIGSPPADQVR